MGRLKVHASNAEKQASYRERRQLERDYARELYRRILDLKLSPGKAIFFFDARRVAGEDPAETLQKILRALSEGEAF